MINEISYIHKKKDHALEVLARETNILDGFF